METTSQAYIKRYNESARLFKILFVLNRNFHNMNLGEEHPVPPFDLNQIYGKMTVLRKMLDNPQSEQVIPFMEDLENQIAAAWHWYEALDRRITPFILRSYCEQNPDLPTEHMMLLLQFLLNKSEHTEVDQGKIDYLLTQIFCVTDQSGAIRLRAASEDELRTQIEKLFPPSTHFQVQGVERLIGQLSSLIAEIFQVSTFENLISGDYINRGRKLKASMGNAFYHPTVLAKCVQLNTLLRQKFMQLYSIESENIKQFSELLINTGKNQIGLAEGGFSVESALEFSESTGQMLNADYSTNSDRLRTFVRIREMLTKAVTSYGLDPKHASNIEAVDLNEESLAARLNSRREWLKRVLSEQTSQHLATALQIVELERSRLVVSGWERAALLAEGDAAKQPINDCLSRAAALISEINESYAYYRSQSTTAPHLSDTHLMAVNYYIMQAHQLANQLEQISNQMREKGDIESASDLSATRHKLLDTCWKIKV